MRIACAERCRTGTMVPVLQRSADMQHITLASHTSLVLAHVALAPQVEFELLEGVEQQNTSGQDIR